MRRRRRAFAAAAARFVVLLLLAASATARGETGYFGVAQVSINPTTPILLAGYAGRTVEATQIQQDITAQAAAFGAGADASLLITFDSTGVPTSFVDSVASAISAAHGIPRERVNIAVTHSHNAPEIAGYATNILTPTATQQQHIDTYTQLVATRLMQAADQALANRTPGNTLTWGVGSAQFGQNRRGQAIAPNDHDLPVLRITDAGGATKAIVTSYATHGTTLNNNLVSGDWPGYAREKIQELYPGSVALVMLGAAGDSDPQPRVGPSSVTYAQDHGQEVANEVQRLVSNNLLRPASFAINAAHTDLSLDYATELTLGDPGGARLAPSPGALPYGVTSWMFGDDLAMTFFEGELVSDYSLRLKSNHDDGRLWVNGYTNGVDGYIPSERILYEGGYEPDSASYWYNLPGRFAHGLENKIIGAAEAQLQAFYNPSDRLKLTVNVANGRMTISNPSGAAISLDAYTVVANENRFNPANAAWLSWQDQGLPGWDEADNASASRLTEFRSIGATAVAADAALTLGAPFLPSAPATLGQPLPTGGLQFEYSVPGVGAKKGIVEYVGGRNNLVLTIDPLTGEAAIQNQSPFFDAALDAYTIASAKGDLRTGAGGWSSLHVAGESGWQEAGIITENRVTEFNPTASTLLEGNGRVLSLGQLVDIAGGILSADDFQFQFSTADGRIITGLVVIGSLPTASLDGDYDGDGDVDGGDLLAWQRTLGQAAIPEGAGADGNRNGIVDAPDLAVWRSHFGMAPALGAAGAANEAVAEPSSAALAAALSLAAIAVRRARYL